AVAAARADAAVGRAARAALGRIAGAVTAAGAQAAVARAVRAGLAERRLARAVAAARRRAGVGRRGVDRAARCVRRSAVDRAGMVPAAGGARDHERDDVEAAHGPSRGRILQDPQHEPRESVPRLAPTLSQACTAEPCSRLRYFFFFAGFFAGFFGA